MAPSPIEHLRDAINSHDPARVADCFTENYRCELPLHPSRSFTGRARVFENYQAIFAPARAARDPSQILPRRLGLLLVRMGDVRRLPRRRPERHYWRRNYPVGG